MKFIAFALLAAVLSAAETAPKCCYVSRAIACDEKEERYVEMLYGSFLTLLSEGSIEKKELMFPARFAQVNESFAIVGLAYYISPNLYKSFEIAIPRSAIIEHNGMMSISTDLRLKSKDFKQGTCILELVKREPKNKE